MNITDTQHLTIDGEDGLLVNEHDLHAGVVGLRARHEHIVPFSNLTRALLINIHPCLW